MSQKIKCLIVEDEPIATEVLEDYVAQVPHLQLVASCRDALYALEVLKEQSVDLIFLDIHLPKLKGIDFVKTLKEKPHIIFTTAYHQYAVEGFEVEALDYLLKPIEFSRFLQAVNRVPVKEKIEKDLANETTSNQQAPHLFFKVNKKNVKVFLHDIQFIESLKDYVQINTADKQLLVKYPIGELEQRLPAEKFIRVHRSFIIAIEKISAYSKEIIEIGTHQIPIGRSYKEAIKGKF